MDSDPVIKGNCDICEAYNRLSPARKSGHSNQSCVSLRLDGRVAQVTWLCSGCCCEDAEISDAFWQAEEQRRKAKR